MENPLKRGSWLVTIPLVGAVLGYMVWVFMPTKRAIAELHQELQSKQNYVAEAGRMAARIRHVEEEMKATREYNSTWSSRSAASTSASISAKFGEIARIMTDTGVITTRFDPQQITDHARLQEIPLQLGCRGSLTQILSLVNGIEGLPFRIWLSDLKWEQVGEDSENMKCEIILAIFSDNPEISD
jgi:Tfp pilus assembly protein PilO